jgi:hypothetical protein
MKNAGRLQPCSVRIGGKMKILKKRPSAKQRILQELCDEWPGSIPLFDLILIGGTCAYRRIKELQYKHGIEIDFYHEVINGKYTNNTRYFLMPDPRKVDIENLCLRS